jgi:hypothetical protein
MPSTSIIANAIVQHYTVKITLIYNTLSCCAIKLNISKSAASSTMSAIIALLTLFVLEILMLSCAQPLNVSQYTALMNLYSDMGENFHVALRSYR